jgi:hypothetical protein
VSASGKGAGSPIFVRDHLSAAVGMNRYFGRLLVTFGEVYFEPRGVGNKLNPEPAAPVRHDGDTVVVAYARFGFPWMNTGVVLTDAAAIGQSTATVLLPAWHRSSVIDAIRNAGFDVEVYPTVFSAGGEIGSLTELDRFRRGHQTGR